MNTIKNSPRTIRGWLFDLYPTPEGITLWLVDEDGNKHCCRDRFTPAFYLHLRPHEAERVKALGRRYHLPISLDHDRKTELYTGQTLDVLKVNVHQPTRLQETVWTLERFFPHFAFFNSDIPAAQMYLYHTRLFPLAYGEYTVDENGWLTGFLIDDKFDAVQYRCPELTVMTMRNVNDTVAPKYQRVLELEISYDGSSYLLEQEDPTEALQTLNWHLQRCDPDVILTDWGDASLMPFLRSLSDRLRIPLLLNRDTNAGYFTTKESSYFTYGKIVHKDGAFELAGRWHLDVQNSFIMDESDFEGLYELARLTQIPIQHQARTSIGTGLSSMQLSWAYRNNVLIPAKKREPEDFKSASTLLLADRGGLIFQPVMGYHEDVAELDFASMYPSLMEMHNISPETVNCHCCHNSKVPELGYTICEKKRGIVPETLKPILAKRAYYKRMKREATSPAERTKYDRRQNALKWMLVTCFGYLGYKNARFGKIEAHETVNAFSRDALLSAKEVAEANGFTLIHGIVDCLWLKPSRHRSGGKEGATEADYENLCRKIKDRVGVDITLEGIYSWILFPASKMDSLTSVANRYVGWYKHACVPKRHTPACRHGELKVRGIELRRRDTPLFVKKVQAAALECITDAKCIEEIQTAIPAVLRTVDYYIHELREGRANPLELVIRRHISQEPNAYVNESLNAVVAKAIEEAGIHLSPGEMIEYIILDHTGREKPEKAKPLALYDLADGYDAEKYTEITLKAIETLLQPFGYDVEKLKEVYGVQKPKRRVKLLAADHQPTFTTTLLPIPHPLVSSLP
jgi:DNA polymerase-2